MMTFTKESLIEELIRIHELGWIPNARPGNAGGVGNTLEDLLGIKENNLPIPNAAEWELKCQRSNTTSLTTLFHMEPSPRAMRFVPKILLPNYGWQHELAGTTYPLSEMSFRQTISGKNRSDRGFCVVVNKNASKVEISFDSNLVDPVHDEWLNKVNERVGLGELNPQPYWGFTDLNHKAGTKILNCFYVQADVKIEEEKEFFLYNHAFILQGYDFTRFLDAINKSSILIDFDARTGHNHGTKFRLRQNARPFLYSNIKQIY